MLKALLVFFVLFFVAWDLAWMAAGVDQTPPWRLRDMLGASPRPQLLDVRTRGEFALFHIPGAISRPDALSADPASLGLDPSRPVVVVCMTGHRSPFVAKMFAAKGFAASNLTWGMLGWVLAGGAFTSGSWTP